MDEEEIRLGQQVTIDLQLFPILRGVLEKTPFPDESTVDGLPSPKRVLECLEEIAASGRISTEEQMDSYRMVKNVYPEYLVDK